MQPGERDAGLTRLEEHLNLLLATIQNGNWEGVVAATEDMKVLMENVGHSDFRKSSPEEANAIHRILSLLEASLEKCTERRQQIAPLLDALAGHNGAPPSP